MQPYFFPYLGYFSLIKNTEYFLFFDTPQYIRKGWINRNRILKGDGSDTYFTVPVEKQHREAAINEVRISNNSPWKEKIMGQLLVYKKRAPFYNDVMDVVGKVLDKNHEYISELAIDSIVSASKYMGMELKYDVCSKMNLPNFDIKEPDEWALNITEYMKYDTYVNPPGGKSFFSPEKYKEKGIKLQFLSQNLPEYNQHRNNFTPGLSIIDVMMYCKPEEILEMMNDYILEGDL